MNNRNRILSQISITVIQYNLEIEKIKFTKLNETTEKVDIVSILNGYKFGFIYTYEINKSTKVNDFFHRFSCVIRELKNGEVK